ncbi:MAG: TatD family deoxyribonuclease [Acidobacteria bacterium]|nr:MAG: TatD family deoxyribonuclease [Acidobacteriota bacterium]PYY03039.1 MAG: TatD family deoxyribonuclease [Acidobacteriota bacterium]PYY21976.1 MAG: TatD family deoxyribonuclease [Acidobacteriota bacterium]
MLVDSHAHLEGPRFDSDRAEMLERARAAGVVSILAIGSGTGPGTLDCAIRIAEQHDWIYASIGIHPHEARLATGSDYTELESLARHPRVIGFGEIGLDYYYDHSPRDVQHQVFIRQMEIARAAKLPIIIHCRPSDNSENAWDDTLRLVREHWASTGFGGVLHCFTGEPKHAKAALDMGFMISFSGNVTFPKAENIREVARTVPEDRMFIETDSPFLAPSPYRGKRNEPAFVIKTAEKIAELRGKSTGEIGEITANNFFRFFRLPPLKSQS